MSAKSVFRSVAFLAACSCSFVVSAAWTYDDSAPKDLRISDGNWNFTVTKKTVGGVNQLTITKCNAGTGELDLTDFAVDGYVLYALDGGNNPILTASGAGAATGTLKLPASIKVIGRYVGFCAIIEAIDGPGVETIGLRSFQYTTSLKSANFPAIKIIYGHGSHPTFTSLETVTLGPDLEKLDDQAFVCPNLRSITPKHFPKLTSIGNMGLCSGGKVAEADADWPTVFPALTTIGTSAFKGAPFGSFSAPKLEVIPASAFQECKNMKSFSASKATVTGSNAFYDCSSLTDLDIDFDSLTEVYQNMFRNTKIASFDLPNVTALGSYAFGTCPNLKRVICSQKLTSMTEAFWRTSSLEVFEPLFPTNLTTTLTAAAVYNSCKLANSEVVYDFPAIPAVPASLCANPTNISKVTFYSDVTSIGENAFQNLRPKAQIVFHGTSVPTLGTNALYYNGEKNNDRIVISFDNPDAKANWQAAITGNATLFASSYKDQKPDYPGEKTIGLLTLATGVYAWVVNNAPESETSYLVVHGNPDEVGTVDPAYGLNSGLAIGTSFDCTAPASFDDGSYKATLAGYAVSNVNELGVYTFVAEGTGNSYRYTQAKDAGDLTWIWTDRQYRIRANVQGGGSVDVSDQWVAAGETVTITATPDDGQLFRYWSGDIGNVSKRGRSITLTADQARTVTAVFGTEAEAKMHWVYDAKNSCIYDISADGQDINWKMTVFGTADSLSIGKPRANFSLISGVGELDLRNFTADTGATITMLATASGSDGSGLSRELTTAVYLPESVTNVAYRSFGNVTSLKTISLPGVCDIGYEAFLNCGIEGEVVLPKVEVIGNLAFAQCSKMTSLVAPSIVRFASDGKASTFNACLALTNITAGCNLETIDAKVFSGLVGLRRFGPDTLPMLKTIGLEAFSSVGRDVEEAVLPTNYPALVSAGGSSFANASIKDAHMPLLKCVPGSMFKGSRLENFYGVSVTNVAMHGFDGPCFTNVVLSHALLFVEDDPRYAHARYPAFGKVLRHMEPFFPTNLIGNVNDIVYSKNRMDDQTDMIWNYPSIPEIPADICANPTNLQHIVFFSDVTAIGANAFPQLPPKARVEFHGTSVPALGTKALFHDGEADDTRVVIVVKNRAAIPAWKTAVVENAGVFRTEYRRRKADYPGAGTIGLLKLGAVTVSKVSHNVYAWVVNGNPDGLTVLVR